MSAPLSASSPWIRILSDSYIAPLQGVLTLAHMSAGGRTANDFDLDITVDSDWEKVSRVTCVTKDRVFSAAHSTWIALREQKLSYH